MLPGQSCGSVALPCLPPPCVHWQSVRESHLDPQPPTLLGQGCQPLVGTDLREADDSEGRPYSPENGPAHLHSRHPPPSSEVSSGCEYGLLQLGVGVVPGSGCIPGSRGEHDSLSQLCSPSHVLWASQPPKASVSWPVKWEQPNCPCISVTHLQQVCGET